MPASPLNPNKCLVVALDGTESAHDLRDNRETTAEANEREQAVMLGELARRGLPNLKPYTRETKQHRLDRYEQWCKINKITDTTLPIQDGKSVINTIVSSVRCNVQRVATISAALIDQRLVPQPLTRAAVIRFAVDHLASNLTKYAEHFPTPDHAWEYLKRVGMVDEIPVEEANERVATLLCSAAIDTQREPSADFGEPPAVEAVESEDTVADADAIEALLSEGIDS